MRGLCAEGIKGERNGWGQEDNVEEGKQEKQNNGINRNENMQKEQARKEMEKAKMKKIWRGEIGLTQR